MHLYFYCLCYTLFKCLRQLVARGSDQLESPKLHFTFDDFGNLMLF